MYHGWADYVVYGGLPLTATMKANNSANTIRQYVEYLENVVYNKLQGCYECDEG